MQIVSFLMSAVMMVASLFVPAGTLQSEKSLDDTAQVSSESSAGLLSEEAKEVLSVVVSNIVNEAKNGTSESQEVLDAINNLPVYENGEERTDRRGVNVSEFKKAFDKALKEFVNKNLPDGTIKNFLNHLTSGMYDLYIYLVPVEGEDEVYYFYCDYVDNEGNATVVFTGARYDKKTGEIHGKDNNGIMGIGFDYDVKNYTVTTPVNVWMRNMGYSVLYDIVGGLGFMNTDTVRVKFEYGGKYWMFQFWKGNYGFNLLNGAELGIYNKTEENAFWYDCAADEEMLNMSMVLSRGDEILVEREEMRHWWMCGFRFGPAVPLDELVMESTIQFEDEGMMNAFLEAAEEFEDEMNISAENLKVSIMWK